MEMIPRSVLITGTNRGLGLEFVKQFITLADPPKHVFAGCRNPAEATALQEIANANSTVTILQLDVTDDASISACVRTIQRAVGDNGLNLLINNAGAISLEFSLAEVTSETMMKLYHVNTVGPVMVTKACQPLLEQAARRDPESPMSCSRSAIINISTGVASIAENSSGKFYSYRCSKAGLNMMTTNLCIEFKDSGILSTAIHPGWVQTDLGGPTATMTTTDSVSRVMAIMAGLQGEAGNGKFYHWKGHEMAW